MGRVRDAFSLSLFHSMATLQRSAAALLRGDREAVTALNELLHRLVGTAGSLGFDALSTRSRALESSLHASDDRWYSKLFGAVRALDEAMSPMRSVALCSLRTGTARARTMLTTDDLRAHDSAFWPMQFVASATSCPHPPRGVLLVDARRDAMSRVRAARAVWGSAPIVAIAPEASEAELLLSLRAGADMVARDAISDESLCLAAYCALPLPFSHANALMLDADPMRVSSVRAAIEPLGARLHLIDSADGLDRWLRTTLPHVALIDAQHREASAVAEVLAKHGPAVRVLSMGEAAFSDRSLELGGSFHQLLRATLAMLVTAVGPDDVAALDSAPSTQTLKISKADLRSLAPRKEPSRP